MHSIKTLVFTETKVTIDENIVNCKDRGRIATTSPIPYTGRSMASECANHVNILYTTQNLLRITFF